MDLATISNSAVDFVGTDGNTYSLSVLSLREIAEFCKWLKYRDYVDAKELGLPKDELKEVYKECREKEVVFGDSQTLAALKDPEAIQKLFWLSIRIKHPDILETDVSQIINMRTFIDDLSDELTNILGLTEKTQGN